MTLETYEDVSEAVDEWLKGDPTWRTFTCGVTANGEYFCRFDDNESIAAIETSEFSSNDAQAKALASL